MLFIALISLLFALPSAQHTEYLRRIASPKHPPVLVLISPGWDEQMLTPLLQHLWKEGFSVWTLRFSHHAQDLNTMSINIHEAIAQHQDPFVVAQGLSSIVFMQNIDEYQINISGLALLGAPIQPFCSPALIHALQKNSWTHFQNIQLKHANPTFHELVHSWCMQRTNLRSHIPVNDVWAATTNIHPIAPPESIRSYLHTDHRFVRSGPLALHGREPTHHQLPSHHPTLSDLTTWLWKQKPWDKP